MASFVLKHERSDLDSMPVTFPRGQSAEGRRVPGITAVSSAQNSPT